MSSSSFSPYSRYNFTKKRYAKKTDVMVFINALSHWKMFQISNNSRSNGVNEQNSSSVLRSVSLEFREKPFPLIDPSRFRDILSSWGIQTFSTTEYLGCTSVGLGDKTITTFIPIELFLDRKWVNDDELLFWMVWNEHLPVVGVSSCLASKSPISAHGE